MKRRPLSPLSLAARAAAGAGSIAFLCALAGCGTAASISKSPTSPITGPIPATTTAQGVIHGGQQPVSGATIQLYAVGTPATGSGYGVGATALLTAPVTTAQDGSFSITGLYTCPTPATQVYLVATGGNPGLTGTVNNSGIAMMAALGNCPAGGNLLASVPYIFVDEVTTVSAVWALQQFMAPPSAVTVGAPNIGAPTATYDTGTSVGQVSSGVIGLSNAFVTASVLADIATGSTPNKHYTYATPESSKINAIADILAYCINSDPATSTNCADLFAAATPAGKTLAADTIQAAWYMAQNPINNNSTLYGFISSEPPFLPKSSNLNDMTIAINYAPTNALAANMVVNPYSVAIDAYGNAWLTNGTSGTASIMELGVDGSALLTPITTFTASATSGAASQITTPVPVRTVTTPKGVAVDLNNRAWAVNYDNVGTPSGGSVGVFNGSSAPGTGGVGLGVTTSTGYYVGYQPVGIAIDGSNNVFVANTGTASSSVLDGRSLAKLAAADGTYTYSTSASSTNTTAAYSLAGGTALVAVDTNPNTATSNVWVANYNSCKVQGNFNATTPFGVISQYATDLTPLPDSDAVTAASGTATGANGCGSGSVYIGQEFTAPTANPFGIAIDRNNGVWLSDQITSSLGFDGLTYLSAPTTANGFIPSSYYLVNGVAPTASTSPVAGTTLTKAGAVAVDGNNNAWISNQTAKSVVEATFTGTGISLLTPGQGGSFGSSAYGLGFAHNTGTSTGIAIDPSGNVWVTNANTSSSYTNQSGTSTVFGNSVTVVVGAAGPVVTPLSLAVKTKKLGAKP